MSDKKYFWLKLKENFFNTKEIKKLRKIAGGDTYTIIYLKLQLLSMRKDCLIEFENTEKDIFEQLQLEIDEDIENIKLTVAFLKNNNLIELTDNQDIFVSSAVDNIGKEGSSAERVRLFRERKKQDLLLQCNNIVTISNTEIEKDKEKEIDIKEEKNKNIYNLDFIENLAFKELIKEWIDYKQDIKDMYKSNKSIKACYEKLIKLSNNNISIAREIINNSIANGYKGFFELKNNKQQDKIIKNINGFSNFTYNEIQQQKISKQNDKLTRI